MAASDNVEVHQRQYYARYIGPTTLVTVSGTTARSAALTVGGRYEAMCDDADVYIRQGGGSVEATTDDCLLPRGDVCPFNVDSANEKYIAVLGAGVGGTLRITRTDQVT